ncbi:uncharacterized protein BO97DRAFT_419688 [Aspergillus homomorphus CBS 101889]|uniref:Uncharacterized protein n=1 Tax=Aspergillus homomorphus (strain CBS 101889) TaxID=1450537 RepID=A0A395IB31_ASPHC|nr:hypothetical protein BO97DRAFT_419688 [Aspergillus homomorphus CBS 101889]RAL17450.1 hypothetical protein BO97DRAFT_419688 [Aspergillus homomorphus CBS 101889]
MEDLFGNDLYQGLADPYSKKVMLVALQARKTDSLKDSSTFPTATSTTTTTSMAPIQQNIYIGQGGRATIMALAGLRPRAPEAIEMKKAGISTSR